MRNCVLSCIVFFMTIIVNTPTLAGTDCDFKHPGKLTIDVTDEHRRPLSNVKIIITKPPSINGRAYVETKAKTDYRGHYWGKLCAGIFKGDVSTQLSKKGYYTVWQGYTMKPNGKVALKVQMSKIPLLTDQDLKYRASHYTHNLKLKTPTEFNEGIKGIITDLDGKPIENVGIRIDAVSPLDNISVENNGYDSPTFIHARSGSDGTFQQVLPPGVYDVAADIIERDGFYTARKQIFVHPKVISTLNFALENSRE